MFGASRDRPSWNTQNEECAAGPLGFPPLPQCSPPEELVIGAVGASALFSSRFRENAARALLLPRRRPGSRTPLWQMRQRSSQLLAVASRYGLRTAVLIAGVGTLFAVSWVLFSPVRRMRGAEDEA